MAVVLDPRTRTRITLGARALVGRAPGCKIRLDDPWVSGEHASIYWRDEGWELHDLGSRNGTWVNEYRVPQGGRAVIRAGMNLAFGSTKLVWHLVDDGPPVATARGLEGQGVVRAEGGMLLLPNDDEPVASVYEADLGWHLDGEGGTRLVADQELIEAGGSRWVLELPDGGAVLAETSAQSSRAWLSFATIGLRFRVSLDQEHVSLAVVMGSIERQLAPRAYHELLLVLARSRLDDKARGLPEPECGWVYTDDLARMVASEPTKVNVDIFRARQQLQKQGVTDAARLVERRPTTRQLRLGVERIEIA